MTIKEIFDKGENGTLTFDQFEAIATEQKAKFADLAEGKYVDIAKMTNGINAKDEQIKQLNETIGKRDNDLKALKEQLEAAGADTTKLAELQKQFEALQAQNKQETESYKNQLAKQAYEFAVKEFAGNQKFTSNAAKRDFISSMIKAELKFDNGSIMGGDDFMKKYSADNADAFVVENKQDTKKKASFVDSATGNQSKNTRPSFSDLMKAKNENPNFSVSFD